MYMKVHAGMLTGGERAASVGISGVAGGAVADRVVVGNTTLRFLAAETSTRVDAFQVDTGQMYGALRAGEALWPAAGCCIAMVAFDARTHWNTTAFQTLGVLAARRRKAGVRILGLSGWRNRLWNRVTIRERISRVTFKTRAHDDVVGHVALSLNAASSDAGIHTFVPLAGLVIRTVAIQNTLWLTANVWVSEVIVFADTYAKTILLLTFCVNSAWRWMARIRLNWSSRW